MARIRREGLDTIAAEVNVVNCKPNRKAIKWELDGAGEPARSNPTWKKVA